MIKSISQVSFRGQETEWLGKNMTYSVHTHPTKDSEKLNELLSIKKGDVVSVSSTANPMKTTTTIDLQTPIKVANNQKATRTVQIFKPKSSTQLSGLLIRDNIIGEGSKGSIVLSSKVFSINKNNTVNNEIIKRTQNVIEHLLNLVK